MRQGPAAISTMHQWRSNRPRPGPIVPATALMTPAPWPMRTVIPARYARPATAWLCRRQCQRPCRSWRTLRQRIRRGPLLPVPTARWAKNHRFPDVQARTGSVLAAWHGLLRQPACRDRAIFSIALLACQEIVVTIRLVSNPPAWPALLALVLLPLGASVARAQAPASPPAAAPAATTSAAPAAFRSALEDYRPYTEEKTVNWKEANDSVGRIGGWRAYAKEAAQPEPPAPAAPARSAPHDGKAKP